MPPSKTILTTIIKEFATIYLDKSLCIYHLRPSPLQSKNSLLFTPINNQAFHFPSLVRFSIYNKQSSCTLVHQLLVFALVLMGLSLIPRPSGEKSSGAMDKQLEGLVGFESLLDEEAKCGCL